MPVMANHAAPRLRLLLALAFQLAACSSSDNGQTGSPGGSSGIGSAGSGGSSEIQCDGSTCDEQLDDILQELLGPVELPPSVIGAACEWGEHYGEVTYSGTSGFHCACELSEGEPVYISWIDAGCAYRGPHTYDCLIHHGEIDPCDPDDASACMDTCMELGERIAADAMRSLDYEVLGTQCDTVAAGFESQGYDRCNGAVRIDDICYPASIDGDRKSVV